MKRIVVLITLCYLATGSWQALAGETVKQREQREGFQRQLEMRLSEVRQKLDSLGNKPATMKEEYQRELTQLTQELPKKLELVGRKMTELRSATGLDWERLKVEANSAIDDLNRVYERMKTLYRNI